MQMKSKKPYIGEQIGMQVKDSFVSMLVGTLSNGNILCGVMRPRFALKINPCSMCSKQINFVKLM